MYDGFYEDLPGIHFGGGWFDDGSRRCAVIVELQFEYVSEPDDFGQ
jgi:hypothetical protein